MQKTERLESKNKIINEIKLKKIVIVQGLRRIGKTLLAKTISEDSAFSEYTKLNLRIGIFGQDDFKEALAIINTVKDNPNNKYFVFIDEFQDLKDWNKFLKDLYEFENVKVIATGSISAMTEGVAHTEGGRFSYIHIHPLSFNEFLKIHNKLGESRMAEHFNEYAKMGSYPDQDFNIDINDYRKQVSENIIEKSKNSQTLKNFKIENPQQVNNVLMYLIENVGQTISDHSIPAKLGIHKDTVLKIVDYLKKSFLIYEVANSKENKGRAAQNNKKYYLEDHTFYLFTKQSEFQDLDETYKSFVFENIIFNQIRSKFDRYEVEIRFEIDKANAIDLDLVTLRHDKKKFFEIKYSKEVTSLSKNQKAFAEKNELNVIYLGETKKIDSVQFINYIEFCKEVEKWI